MAGGFETHLDIGEHFENFEKHLWKNILSFKQKIAEVCSHMPNLRQWYTSSSAHLCSITGFMG